MSVCLCVCASVSLSQLNGWTYRLEFRYVGQVEGYLGQVRRLRSQVKDQGHWVKKCFSGLPIVYETEYIRHHIWMVGLRRGVFSKRMRFFFGNRNRRTDYVKGNLALQESCSPTFCSKLPESFFRLVVPGLNKVEEGKYCITSVRPSMLIHKGPQPGRTNNFILLVFVEQGICKMKRSELSPSALPHTPKIEMTKLKTKFCFNSHTCSGCITQLRISRLAYINHIFSLSTSALKSAHQLVCHPPSRHGPDFHRPQSQITIDSPDFHPRRSHKCLLGQESIDAESFSILQLKYLSLVKHICPVCEGNDLCTNVFTHKSHGIFMKIHLSV